MYISRITSDLIFHHVCLVPLSKRQMSSSLLELKRRLVISRHLRDSRLRPSELTARALVRQHLPPHTPPTTTCGFVQQLAGRLHGDTLLHACAHPTPRSPHPQTHDAFDTADSNDWLHDEYDSKVELLEPHLLSTYYNSLQAGCMADALCSLEQLNVAVAVAERASCAAQLELALEELLGMHGLVRHRLTLPFPAGMEVQVCTVSLEHTNNPEHCSIPPPHPHPPTQCFINAQMSVPAQTCRCWV